ncbi:MAG: Sulfide dehydrogenase subunit alpha precursor [Candidatus Bathyarchaeota archaeon BA2]|nr:MAG: Sulfide dehydrogenase subunit alpha precursor [Candidatus Bathyarchaeota archaeon BA2]
MSRMVMTMERWDLIIVGAGPAGLTAGLYGARSGLKTLVLDEKMPGGAVADAPLVENYPGFGAISGSELADKMAEHCKKAGANINELERVVELDLKGEKKSVKTTRAVYTASAVIIASGSHHRTLGVPGEAEFRGRGVSYCTLCDGTLFKGRNVLVVGGGNSAVVSARYLANVASSVKLAHRRDQLRAEQALVEDLIAQGVEIMWNTELKEVKGDTRVKGVVLVNNRTGETKEISVDGVFVQVGEAPNSQIAEEAGIEVDKAGYIVVDSRQRTNISGVYAAGDVTNGTVKQIGTAVGQAIIAASEAFGYIKRPYYYKA